MEASGGPTAGPEERAGWGESAADAAVTPDRRTYGRVRRRDVSPTANPVGGYQGGLSLLPLLAGIPATPVVVGPVAQLIDPAPLSVPLVKVKMRIRRVQLDVLDGTSASIAGALLPRLAGRKV